MDLSWQDQLLDVLLEYRIKSDLSEFAVDMRLERLGRSVAVALRFLPPSGAVRAINKDAEWLRNGPGRGGHDFDQDRGLIELVDRYVVEVLGCDAGTLRQPVPYPERFESMGGPRSRGDQPSGRVHIPVERTLMLLQLQERFPMFPSASEAWLHTRN